MVPLHANFAMAIFAGEEYISDSVMSNECATMKENLQTIPQMPLNETACRYSQDKIERWSYAQVVYHMVVCASDLALYEKLSVRRKQLTPPESSQG
jgi:hypothetical protein